MSKKETFNERWETTKDLLEDRKATRWKRRLDSIARLIENGSMCSAIYPIRKCRVGYKFFIF